VHDVNQCWGAADLAELRFKIGGLAEEVSAEEQAGANFRGVEVGDDLSRVRPPPADGHGKPKPAWSESAWPGAERETPEGFAESGVEALEVGFTGGDEAGKVLEL